MDRAKRLFAFLGEVARLRSEPVRTVASFEQVEWLHTVPEHTAVASALTHERPAPDQPLLIIDRVGRVSPPSVPVDLLAWMETVDIGDADADPQPRSPRMVEGRLVRFEDEYGLSPQYLEWRHSWDQWAEKEHRDAPVRDLYKRLFTAGERISAAPEDLELILGVGLLSWRPDFQHSTQRHVLVAPLAVDFAEDTGRIGVRFAEDFDGLGVEIDMLDPSQRPDPARLRTFTEAATELEGHPLDREHLEPLLRQFANIVGTTGLFSPATEPPSPGPDPVVSLAPAVILRKRSNEGLIRIYSTIEDQLEGLTEVPLGIRQLIDVVEGDEDRDASTKPAEVIERYLPLPANEQQLQIVSRVDSAYHTVVQGPPGTGKTHTIANLVSHLLASGKRVLVTAQTDRALRELQDKLPPAIAQLSVSVVGRSRADLADLRVAVEAIADRAASYDHSVAESEIERLESRLDDLRRERSSLESDLLSARSRETDPQSFGSYEGTLAQIAQRLTHERDRHFWLGQYQPSTQAEAPLSNEGILRWLTLLRDPVIAMDEAEAASVLPSLTSLPEPDEFERWVNAEEDAESKAGEFASVSQHPAYTRIAALDADERLGLRDRMSGLAGAASDLAVRKESWIPNALDDVLQGRSEIWVRRHDELRRGLDGLKPTIDHLGPNPRVHVEGTTTADLVPIAQDLLAHLEAGGRTGGIIKSGPVRRAAPFFERVTVEGLQPNTRERVQRFLEWVRAENELETIEKLWPANVPIPDEDTHFERWAWNETETIQLGRVIVLADSLLAEEHRLIALGIPVPDWSDLDGVRAFATVVDAVVVQERVAESRLPLEDLENYLSPINNRLDAAAVASSLDDAVTHRDVRAYRVAYLRLEKLHVTAERVVERDALGASLAISVPALVTAVSTTVTDDQWDEHLSRFTEAWEWHRTNAWLATEAVDDLQRTQRQLAQTESRIRQTITELTANQAWRHAVSRLGQRERESLQAYSFAMRNLGKGTGRYAPHKRREARKALRSCRTAVPAWVMPTYRIAETLDIDPQVFDVVIIDEASQAGLEASYLQYLAQKVVVVGDHHQVSPSGVGIEKQKMIDLVGQYLPDIDHAAIWEAPDASFFDLARMKYGHMITLREHFRCVPEIIGFSNQLVYAPDRIPLIPLRQFGNDRLEPVKVTHIDDGYEKGSTNKINPPEAEAIVDAIEKCCADPRYDGKTMGVISLTGRAQADHIEQALLDRLGPLEFKARDLRCGDSAAFQGSERDVVFLSMVAAPERDRRLTPLTAERYVQRFNVAGSRAKDQMWLFHSLTLDELTNREDMRFALLNYCTEVLRRGTDDPADVPGLVPDDLRVDPFESLFEQHVFNAIVGRGYIAQPQMPIYGYHIDMVIIGGHGRIAVECDGDTWHGADHYEADMARQRDLERVGWTFFRVRGSAFYRDPEDAMGPLWDLLEQREIRPAGWSQVEPVAEVAVSEPSPPESPPVIEDYDDSEEGDTVDALNDRTEGAEPGEVATAEEHADDLVPDHSELVVGVEVTHPRMGDAKVVFIRRTPSGPLISLRFASGEQFDYTVEEYERAAFELRAHSSATAVMATPPTARPAPQGELAPYTEYAGTGLPDPRAGTMSELCGGLEAVVVVEGPVTADRAYSLFIKAAGFDRVTRAVRSALNRALHSLRTQILIEEFVSPATNWPQAVLRMPGTEPVNVREIGPRDLYDVPLNEIASLMDIIMAGRFPPRNDEALMREVLDRYNLVRLTPKVQSYLEAAIDMRQAP
jgi:very-short-patch-repair endonuclease